MSGVNRFRERKKDFSEVLNSVVHIRSIWSGRSVRIGFLVLVMAVVPYHLSAEEYLSTEEVSAIGIVSLSALFLGNHTSKIDSGKSSLIVNPFPLEDAIQSWLGGQYHEGKSNFLDSDLGSAVTPVGAGLALTLANLAWPRGRTGRDVGQDMFLFTSGLAATIGVTGFTKAVFARPRPYVRNNENFESERYTGNFRVKNSSFFSGHASSAFYVVTFLNLRIRETMRREMSPGKYRDWRWASPLLLYSWATMVGWSRIHAYRHYISDVIVGAVVGWLVAESYYSLSQKLEDNDPNSPKAVSTLFRISIPI